MASRLEAFLAMLERGQDSALLRFSLGSEYLSEGSPADAAAHLAEAVRLDRGYSAAWKLLGKALAGSGDAAAAMDAWREGIEVATEQGDRQAVKEMTVFLRRLEREHKRG